MEADFVCKVLSGEAGVEEEKTTENAYAVLGVSRSSTYEQIKTEYRTRAREFHPDRSGADAAGL